jgi:RNA polymerase sigma-70 factor (ECF subfamily)
MYQIGMARTTSIPLSGSNPRPPPLFVTTRWSVILAAQRDDPANAASALEALCRTYWQPIYAYARRRGHPPHDAEDLAQGFFANLLAKQSLRNADREKGRFRQFLLMTFKRFLANQWDHAHRWKRGGRQTFVPFDIVAAERLFQTEDQAESRSAETAFDQGWALALLDRALSRLRAEFEENARTAEFAALKPALEMRADAAPYSTFAAALGVSEGAARVAVHRFRKRFRQIFREEVARTVEGECDVDNEVRHLIAAISRAA